MPRVTLRRRVAAPPAEVWRLVADPHNLPRWWPRTGRVENVERRQGERRTRWTQVLETTGGRGVRADFRCVGATEPRRYAWEQELEGTPFERHLRAAAVEIELAPAGEGTEVAITSEQSLRGLSRLGGPLMRGGQKRIVGEALDGLERALGGG